MISYDSEKQYRCEQEKDECLIWTETQTENREKINYARWTEEVPTESEQKDSTKRTDE